MTQAANISVTSGDKLEITKFTEGFKKFVELIERWDMRYIQSSPRKIWSLTKKQQAQFEGALRTFRGARLQNDLLNKKTDKILNEFLELEKASIKPDKYKELQGDRQKLKEFVKQVQETPLAGINRVKPKIVGLTKKEMWEAMVKEGIVKP